MSFNYLAVYLFPRERDACQFQGPYTAQYETCKLYEKRKAQRKTKDKQVNIADITEVRALFRSMEELNVKSIT